LATRLERGPSPPIGGQDISGPVARGLALGSREPGRIARQSPNSMRHHECGQM